MTDILRAASGIAVIYCIVIIPLSVWKRTESVRTHTEIVFIVIGIELLLLSRLAITIDRWGKPLVWWGSPITLIACLCLSRSSEIGYILGKKKKND